MLNSSASTIEFNRAIVRTPCKRIVEGLTSATMEKPDYNKALEQHNEYIKALQYCGLEVIILPADERYPDSTFVEDTALLTPHCAIFTNPGAESREGEIAIIRETIADFYNTIEAIKPPGTIEAGDIMRVGNNFYIGLSERTNEEGANQMISILRHYGMDGIPINMNEMLHLKTGLSYIENNYLMITKEFLNEPKFKHFKQLEVSSEEAYAANSVWVNNRVLVPQGFPNTKALIESAGYETIAIDTSEFRKIDGGLSCLSLRF
ncbi:MAG: N(G),N(G)-dimethylarginine dimethylaminohydrolase [Deltaproteobacteria bacterium]|nr:N(G),N(G)-dimethylarginine dimethylaminohydrolase [Deltaproteobacteria bacterium]MBW2200208.1 N(G),N(G)-dimethylarginine dimethylaminohydrolase [Deltaproteobacteria bacterium]